MKAKEIAIRFYRQKVGPPCFAKPRRLKNCFAQPLLSMLSATQLKSFRPNKLAGFQACSKKFNRAPTLKVRCQVATPSQLQEKFGVDKYVTFTEGREGLPIVQLKNDAGASAEIYLFGGCVTSWKQANGSEVLYVRPDAKFDKSKPISGGIPHCFPQFGPGEIQQHGFARNLDWEVASAAADLEADIRTPEVELVLQENDYTLAMWPYKFKAVYRIALKGEETLSTELRVINNDEKPFSFTGALHSYFEVAGIDKAKVKGLKGLTYLDKVENKEKTEERDEVTFPSEVDSVYFGTPNYVELDVGTGAGIAIKSSNWSDVTVWNPWTSMEACYKEFCCVENVQFKNPVTLGPGESWFATADMEVINL
eukprot:TRINITY_DN34203_c0_g1_i1.p1 TRINITY_DN34203_c0_g1~~TRINITY_DN34203_c0_g1_i1.p1  ORF type:complete len:388 (-),score=51.68 TRINITY_DN34203_c0_g1_i1:229-1326(-)